MISSRERAPRHGPGRLLVDGTDDHLCRKAKLAFRPTPRHEAALLGLLGVCVEAYNAGIARASRRLAALPDTASALFDQFNQITHLRGVRDDVLAWGIQPLRGDLRRVDEAYSAFYRRCCQRADPRPSSV